MIEEILNHWLVQFIIIGSIILLPTVILGKKYLTERYEYHKTVLKNQDDKVKEMNTITGQLKFVLDNPDLAYNQLHGEIKEADKMINEFSGGSEDQKKMRDIWEKKKKSAEWKLKIVTKILENKQYVDFIGKDTIIPLIGGLEKKIKGYIKGGFGGFGL